MIVDSTVLISLGKLEKMEFIQGCIIPGNVLKEITKQPAKRALLALPYQEINPKKESSEKALSLLGDNDRTGDSDIVALLLEFPSSLIATDDRRLRNVCSALGGRITGTLGILIHSVKTRETSKEHALSMIDRLQEFGFRMSVELYNFVKKTIKEISI